MGAEFVPYIVVPAEGLVGATTVMSCLDRAKSNGGMTGCLGRGHFDGVSFLPFLNRRNRPLTPFF